MAPFPKFLSLGQTATKYTMRMIEKVVQGSSYILVLFSSRPVFSLVFAESSRQNFSFICN
jgi:hypothetical protein